jgi:hypothetical protein
LGAADAGQNEDEDDVRVLNDAGDVVVAGYVTERPAASTDVTR